VGRGQVSGPTHDEGWRRAESTSLFVRGKFLSCELDSGGRSVCDDVVIAEGCGLANPEAEGYGHNGDAEGYGV
jgi:hypothetical protein